MPLTIPIHSLATALSGALHVEPPAYLDCVRSGQIRIVTGTIGDLRGDMVTVTSAEGTQTSHRASSILLATGFRLVSKISSPDYSQMILINVQALPFFSEETCQQLGLLRNGERACNKTDFPYIRLYRLIVPPGTTTSDKQSDSGVVTPQQRTAFNGFAYSLLNPTVAHVTAHWISDYFTGRVRVSSQSRLLNEGNSARARVPNCFLISSSDIDAFHAWQSHAFGQHGAKGTHIGPHATLYTDTLLSDMGLRNGHVDGSRTWPLAFLKEWFRPMYPEIYARLANDRQERDRLRLAAGRTAPSETMTVDVEALASTREFAETFMYQVIYGVLGIVLCWVSCSFI